MSHIAVMAVEILWFLLLLFSVDSAHVHRDSQGLFCVNDYINNVSCTWSGSPLTPGMKCFITSVRKKRQRFERHTILENGTCQLEQRGISPPGCSFVFGKPSHQEFQPFTVLPYIRMECNGTLLDKIEEYKPKLHTKMHPPRILSLNITANETWISWNEGSPKSAYITVLKFEVQIKKKGQTWMEAHTWPTSDLQLQQPSEQLRGHRQIRVRVSDAECSSCHWSNWSPVRSWEGAPDPVDKKQDKGGGHIFQGGNQISVEMWTVIGSCVFIFVVLLVFNGNHIKKRCLRLQTKKPVPNPSKYFCTLHSVHGGNFKKWLNPLSTPESFFTAQPCDHISPVELCNDSEDVLSASPSSSSTSALLHFKSYPSSAPNSDRVVDNSSSSSCFSNMGYFLSSSSGISTQPDPNPAYFTYQDDFHNPHNSRKLHLSICPSVTSSPAYESLKREPQSPDSGVGIGTDDVEHGAGDVEVDVKMEVSVDHQAPPLFILPLQPFPPASSLLPPSIAPSFTLVSSDSQQVDIPEAAAAAAAGCYSAWPSAGAMCRSSSMPVETCKTGYLTLKELQTTFSNKSI